MVIEPQKIEHRDIPGLLKDSLALMSRRAIWFALLGLLNLVVHSITAPFMMLFSPIFSIPFYIAGCLIAKSADESTSPIVEIFCTNLRSWFGVFKIILIHFVFFIAIAILFAAFIYTLTSEPINSKEVAKTSLGIFDVGRRAASDIGAISLIDIFFAPGIILLIVLFNPSLPLAYSLCIKNLHLNLGCLSVIYILVSFTRDFLCAPFGFLYFIFFPFSCCLSYVMFRVVFIGRKNNLERKTFVSISSSSRASDASAPVDVNFYAIIPEVTSVKSLSRSK